MIGTLYAESSQSQTLNSWGVSKLIRMHIFDILYDFYLIIV